MVSFRGSFLYSPVHHRFPFSPIYKTITSYWSFFSYENKKSCRKKISSLMRWNLTVGSFILSFVKAQSRWPQWVVILLLAVVICIKRTIKSLFIFAPAISRDFQFATHNHPLNLHSIFWFNNKSLYALWKNRVASTLKTFRVGTWKKLDFILLNQKKLKVDAILYFSMFHPWKTLGRNWEIKYQGAN